MYKVVVNAHNMKEISTEPVLFSKRKGESLPQLLAQTASDIVPFTDRDGFKNWSLTIEISEVKE
jgi:hypothetical protein